MKNYEMSLTFTIKLEYEGAPIDRAFVRESLELALDKLREEGLLTPDDAGDTLFVAYTVE